MLAADLRHCFITLLRLDGAVESLTLSLSSPLPRRRSGTMCVQRGSTSCSLSSRDHNSTKRGCWLRAGQKEGEEMMAAGVGVKALTEMLIVEGDGA